MVLACEDDGKEAGVTFFWNIENLYCRRNDVVESSVFEVETIEKTFCTIIIYFYNYTDERVFCYNIEAYCDRGSEVIQIEYDLALLVEDGSVLQTNEREKIDLQRTTYILGSEFSLLRKDIAEDKREAFLSQDSVIVRCRVWRFGENTMMPRTVFARNSVTVEKRNFLWNIARFGALESEEKDSYIVGSNSRCKFLNFNIGVKENEVTIYVQPFDMRLHFLKFQAFITNANGSRIDCEKCGVDLLNGKKKALCTLPFTRTFLIDNKMVYLKNDSLVLYCECTWSDCEDIDRIERIDYGITTPYVPTREIPQSWAANATVEQIDTMVDLKEDFQCLYVEGFLSDVKIRTATQTFDAHKIILSARYPVFRTMFSTDVKDKIQESVEVLDVEADTLLRMLRYMYTNTLEDLEWESALKLYAAAEKYKMLALMSKCSSFLKRNL